MSAASRLRVVVRYRTAVKSRGRRNFGVDGADSHKSKWCPECVCGDGQRAAAEFSLDVAGGRQDNRERDINIYIPCAFSFSGTTAVQIRANGQTNHALPKSDVHHRLDRTTGRLLPGGNAQRVLALTSQSQPQLQSPALCFVSMLTASLWLRDKERQLPFQSFRPS